MQELRAYIEAEAIFASFMESDPFMPDGRIYLDHAATTPMLPEAVEAMRSGFEIWANPSSAHAGGRAAREALEQARARIKSLFDWSGDLIFTSGATEALAIGLGRANADRRLISAVEHDSVFRAAPDATILPIVDGRIDEDALEQALGSGGRPILALQQVNSEIGARLLLNPNDPIIDRIHSAGGIFLTDCAQSAGRESLPNADMVVVSAHKLGGPPGIGALLVKDLAMLDPTGGQEYGYRGGTENLPGALGFAAALEANAGVDNWINNRNLFDALFDLKDFIWSAGGEVVDGNSPICMRILAIAMPNKSAAAQLIRFDQKGFSVSAGSACSSGSLKPSRALKAFGVADEVAARTIRVSVGWNSTVADIEAFKQAWLEIAESK